jgi:DNA repair protein RadC
MGRRHLSAAMKAGDLLTSPDLVRNYLSAQLRHQPREVFAVLFLDNQNRLITYEELFFGTIDGNTR